jgi:TonB family protein
MKPLTQQPADGVANQTRRQRIDAVLISSDDSFLIELGPLLGDHYRTHTVDSPLALGKLSHKSNWLAVVDVTALPDARVAVSRMGQRYPQAPIIVVASRPAEWNGLIRGPIVAAIAREELSGPRFKEALNAATARVPLEPSGDHAASNRAPTTSGVGFDASLLRLPNFGRSVLSWPVLLTVAVVIGAWTYWSWLSHSNSAKTTPPTVGATVAPGAPPAASHDTAPADSAAPAPSSGTHPQMILELLSAARVQFHDQKLLFPRAASQPRGDSALELYAQVLSQDPSNAEALDGISRLWAIAKGRIQSDLAGGRLDDADSLVAFFKTAGVSDELLRPVTANISAARPKWMLAHARQSIAAGDLTVASQWIGQLEASGTDPDTLSDLRRTLDAKRLEQQLTPLSEQLHAALDAGTLIGPQADNAFARLTAMRTVSRSHPLTLAAQRDVRAALLTRAQQATRAHQFDLAARYLSADAELGSSPEISDARRALQDEVESAKTAAQVSASAAIAPDVVSSAAASAPQASPDQSQTQSESSYLAAKPVRPLNVDYPDTASGEGRVVVEFTLHRDGSASEVTVVDAAPKGVFDRAAINAVRRGRYDARGLIGGVPQRARISLHFKQGS